MIKLDLKNKEHALSALSAYFEAVINGVTLQTNILVTSKLFKCSAHVMK